MYDYYKDNKDVSLGYTVRKHFVENPEEVGYDILLDEITEVNHLAITKSGRGGSSVAVIDSIIGGMKIMRTGIWAWLKSRKQTDSKPSFGKDVFTALRSCKGGTEDEMNSELKAVMDSCSELKDCPQKDTMLDMIRDCYDNREKAFANETELTTAFDSMYVSLSGDSLKEIVDAIKDVSGGGAIGIADSDKEKKGEDCSDSDKGKDEEEKDSDKAEEENKDNAPAQTDSLPMTKEDIAKIVKDSMAEGLRDVVASIVKDTLGIKDDKKDKVEGGQLDANTTPVAQRDYSEFID